MKQKQVLVARCGAIGDLLIASSIFPELKKQGYRTVLYTNDDGFIVFKNNPYVDELIKHNPHLDTVYIENTKKYDLIYNLHGTLEDYVLFKRENPKYYLPWKERQTDINYYEYLFEFCGLEDKTKVLPALYLSDQEKRWLHRLREKYRDKFLIMWNPVGSTVNKLILQSQSYIQKLLNLYPDLQFFIAGDKRCRDIIPGKYENVEIVAGSWSLRETLIATSVMDLVVAPETAIAHAAACWDTPKVVFFSHSKPINLTKHWWNVYHIIPRAECHPCYRIPYQDEKYCEAQISGGYVGAKCTFYLEHVEVVKTIASIIEGRNDRICPVCGVKKNKVVREGWYQCICGFQFEK